ncbi:BTAD domain-containing putative transcriptional regulator [Nocardia terrae]|uniref:BTAD domain-containing putative transcriptional regulator n=1 Tax=Nocardia terrae TaxID=2675851 RepID=UPI0018DF7E89|nr:BTAD domain-containing putative transcriptional regulator [Nocardia terrae]
MVTFEVLGPLRARDERGPLALKGPRHRALLARLLIAHGRVVPLAQLIGDLWEQPPRDPNGTIQTFVSDLRRILEPARRPREPARLLVTAAPGYALRLAADRVDAGRFEALVRSAVEGSPGQAALDAPQAFPSAPLDPDAALLDLDAALSLWQGPAYAEFTDRHWARAEIARLDELRSLAVELRARTLTDLGRHTDALAALESHLHDHPLREPAWHTLALARYRAGRQADALAALREVRRNLREELGVDPGQGLRQLEADVLAQASHLMAPAALESSGGRSAVGRDGFVSAAGGGVDASEQFVGRADEMATVKEVAEQSIRSGRARTVLISGIEGAGKTALARAMSVALRERGWIVGWGASPADSGAPADWPWTRIVSALAAAGRGRPAAVDDREAGALPHPISVEGAAGEALGGVDLFADNRSGGADPALGRFRARQAAVDRLGAAAGRGPVLVVFDDLHWAGAETLELFAALATTPVEGPVLLVGTYRGTDVEAGLAAALARLARVEPVRIQLGGLDVEATGELVRGVVGVGIDGASVRRIHARGQGNPFYTRELARLWWDEGETALDSVPAGVRDVVRHRLERLSKDERAVLAQAAVIGAEVDVELLVELAGDEELVIAAVSAASRAGFLDESGSADVVFVHAVVRDVVYGDIPAPRRSSWHAKIGTLLEAAGNADPAVLAHHFVRAGTRGTAPRAGKYARAAALAAERVFAVHEAARLWADAVTAYERAGDIRAQLEAAMGLVRALAITGRLPQAGTLRAEAIRTAEALGDPDVTARVIVAFDIPTVWTETDDPDLARTVVDAAERALREIPTADPELRCRLLAAIALELRATDPGRARAAVDAAESLAAQLDNPALRALTLNARFLQTFHRAGLAPRRAAIGADLIAVSRAHDLITFEVLGHLIRVQALSATADFDAADHHARAVDELAERYDLPLAPFFTRWYTALRTSISASYQESEAAYRSASAAHPGTAMPGLHRGLLALALFCLRLRHDKSVAAVRPADLGPHAPWAIPLILVEQHRHAEARTALLDLPEPPGDILLELRLCLLARAAAALRERPTMARLRDQLAPAAGELAGAGTGLLTLEPVSHYLALLDSDS